MRRSHLKLLLLLALAAMPLACKSGKGAVDAGYEPAFPPSLSVTRDRKDLLFTYVEEGVFRDVDSMDKVPERLRKQVLVRDLSKRPEEVKAAEFVYVADLTREMEEGGFPVAAVSRYEIDLASKDGELDLSIGELGDGGSSEVVLYGTSWCGACAQARNWFRGQGIAFVDRDIEKDPRAEKEMQRKLRKAGLRLGGVPVIDVRGELVLGFDARKLKELLAKP